jgi:predicted metal-dependent peptidase
MTQDLFSLARLRATIDWPQLAGMIWSLREPIPVVGLLDRCGGAIATDMKWRVYYDPAAVEAWTPGQAATALAHEAWHCLRHHGRRVQSAGIEPRWRKALGVALDVEINGDMNRCTPRPEWPYAVAVPDDFDMPAGLPWEDYYPAAQAAIGPSHVSFGAGGSSADGVLRPWERSGLPGAGPAEQSAVANAVARAIASAPGNAPLGWRRWAGEQLAPPKVPWQRLLAVRIRSGLSAASGAVDYSRQIPSRRQAVTTVILPTLRGPRCAVDIVVDTSGSMSEEDLRAVLAEVEGIIKSAGAVVRVYACDAKVHGGVQRVQRANAVQLLGGGGTDMGAGIAFAEKQRPRASVLVILSDGETPWPKQPPRFARVIVALVRNAQRALRRLPTWAHVVEVLP